MTGKKYFVHESSYVDENVDIGEGTRIWHFSHVQGGARIGKNCSIGQNVNIGNNVVIGNNVKIQNNVSIYEGIILEDFVFCGPSMVFTNIINPRSEFPQRGSRFYHKTIVHRGATLGANSTIVCGNTIGKYAFVGAGAVVTKDIPDYALVVGNPAHPAGWMCACGNKLSFRIDKSVSGHCTCQKCGRKYEKDGQVVRQVS